MNKIPFGKAICYSGYREGQSPTTQIPSEDQIAEDLEILYADGYRYLRMYDPNPHAERVLSIIRKKNLPMQCMVGIDSQPEINNPDCPWDSQNFSEEELAAHAAHNDAELDKLIAMAQEYEKEIFAVSIGNENTPDWGAHTVSEARLIAHAKKLKSAVSQPITFCEGVVEWPNLKELASVVDFLSVHIYPYHYGTPIEDATAVSKKHLEDIQKLYPDKQILLTEIGWSGNDTDAENSLRANLPNQIRYITEVQQWIEEDQVIAFLFEAFDEPWKSTDPKRSECNFGLYNVNRQKKW